MKKTLLIHHHMGLGDHIICNGLVRYIVQKTKKIDKFSLIVKENYVDNIKFMYRDIKEKLEIVTMKKEFYSNEVNYVKKLSKNYSNYLKIGFEAINFPNWEKSFYDQIKVLYTIRDDFFKIKRNFEAEQVLIKKLNLNNKRPFIILNNNTSQGKYDLELFKSQLEKNIKYQIINFSEITNNIFDWIGAIELADRIYSVETSLIPLVDACLPQEKNKYFLLENTRKITYDYKRKNKWEICYAQL
jgi:hypothetical protein